MYLKFLKDPSFFDLLYKIDMDLAEKCRHSPCPHCAAPVHYANYQRKSRYLDEKYCTKFSVCCSVCRQRVYIPSTLFFGSFVYGAAFFIIISCFNKGYGFRYKRLKAIFNVSDRTLRRWKSWWDTVFVGSSFWKEKRALLIRPPGILPLNLVEQFCSLEKVLQFFSHFHGGPLLSRRGC